MPYYLGAKVLYAKNTIAYVSEVFIFIVINTDEDGAILGEQIACEQEAGIDHRAPVGMEASVAFGVGYQTSAVLVVFAAFGIEFVMGLGEIVVVDEVVSRVVRRVDVNELDFAGVVFA